jgi:hypothetical protein
MLVAVPREVPPALPFWHLQLSEFSFAQMLPDL